MDWRKRKYYCVSFGWHSRDMRMRILKSIDGARIHPYKNVPKQFDETEERGNYQFIMSVPLDWDDVARYEFDKAKRNDEGFRCKEIVKYEKRPYRNNSLTKNFREIAEYIVAELEHCGFNDITDSSGYCVIRNFNDGSDRAVDVHKSNEDGKPHYVIYCSYEDEDSDYKYTDDLSVEQLIEKLEEFYFA